MRDDYIKAARAVVTDPYILVNIVSLRVKQLRQGSRPLIESLESLSLANIALREIGEGKISYELADGETSAPTHKPRTWPSAASKTAEMAGSRKGKSHGN